MRRTRLPPVPRPPTATARQTLPNHANAHHPNENCKTNPPAKTAVPAIVLPPCLRVSVAHSPCPRATFPLAPAQNEPTPATKRLALSLREEKVQSPALPRGSPG